MTVDAAETWKVVAGAVASFTVLSPAAGPIATIVIGGRPQIVETREHQNRQSTLAGATRKIHELAPLQHRH